MGRGLRTVLYTVTAVSLIGAASVPTRAGDILMACSADIQRYCSAVEFGNGRLISCLYAHELVVEDACDAAIGDAADVLDTMFASLGEIQRSCGDDIQNYCSDIPPGEGRVLTCLAQQFDSLSDGCAAIAAYIPLEEDEDGETQ